MLNLRHEPHLFEDRRAAGIELAGLLARYADDRPVVLALPRGGVVVGFEVARALRAPLDVVVARKLGAPMQPELGVGAIAPGGVKVILDPALAYLGLTLNDVERVAQAEAAEMARRERLYRDGRPPEPVRDRTVILVDDGLATGVTARAAILSVHRQGPRRVVLAVPVCAAATAEAIAPQVDEAVCVQAPEDFRAVGLWYRDFEQVSDEQVISLLARAREGWDRDPPGGG